MLVLWEAKDREYDNPAHNTEVNFSLYQTSDGDGLVLGFFNSNHDGGKLLLTKKQVRELKVALSGR